MSENLDGFYAQYSASNTTSVTGAGDQVYTSCGDQRYWHDTTTTPYYPYGYPRGYYYSYPCYTVSKTETAFKLVKKFVEMKLIKEPKTFKEFCDLIEEISKTL